MSKKPGRCLPPAKESAGWASTPAAVEEATDERNWRLETCLEGFIGHLESGAMGGSLLPCQKNLWRTEESSVRLVVVLERNPNAQLNLSSAQGRVDCAKGSDISHVVINSAQVSAVENVQEIKPELQIALFTDPGDLIVLEHAGVNLKISRVAIDISGQVAFLRG